jgi:hypothetical protein
MSNKMQPERFPRYHALSELVWLCSVAVQSWSKNLRHLQMKNVLTCISYIFTAMEVVGLLWWNAGNDSHTAKCLRIYAYL